MRTLPFFAGIVVVCASLGFGSTRAVADAKRPVTLAECSAPATSRSLPDAEKLLRHDVEAELAAIDWSRSRSKGKRLLLSAALVRLESVRAGRGVRTDCTVSATLRDERGALVAVLQGHAGGEDDVKRVASVERDALHVAVKGAVARVPEALEKAP